MDDGSFRIDWEKVQAIMIDLSYNFRMYVDRRSRSRIVHSTEANDAASTSTTSPQPHARSSRSSHARSNQQSNPGRNHPFSGLAPNSYVSETLPGPIIKPPNPDLVALDPYGVSGTWMRIVCFLDYNDLYNFNFENAWIPIHEEREPIETREAFRLIRLQLWITKVVMPDADKVYFADLGGADVTGRGLWRPGNEDEAGERRRVGIFGKRKEVGKEGEEAGEGEEEKVIDEISEEWRNWPIVHFEGKSKSAYMPWEPNANSRIRGESLSISSHPRPIFLKDSLPHILPLTPPTLHLSFPPNLTPSPTRNRPPLPNQPNPLDDLLHLPRRRTLALRGNPNRRLPQNRPRRAGELVRQGL
jgi:hypothetical protein